jgi:hypothetical protein
MGLGAAVWLLIDRGFCRIDLVLLKRYQVGYNSTTLLLSADLSVLLTFLQRVDSLRVDFVCDFEYSFCSFPELCLTLEGPI